MIPKRFHRPLNYSQWDGKNDTWIIQGIEQYPQAHISVYNRWGELVFISANGYKNDWAWNVSENVRTNFQKVEELNLHTVAQEKKIQQQQNEITTLKQELIALKNMFKHLVTNQ